MQHRGPDGSGVKQFPEENLALAHRRLSILDVSEAGSQPMCDRSKRYWLTFNGEIFNFIEIRDELSKRGHSFISDTDSEVILSAYSEWGDDCFNRFNGMWAMAIWDTQKKELLLSRDRFGIKPLYYHHSHSLLAFASETNSFKVLEGFERRLDHQKVQISLQDPNCLEGYGHTLFQGIYQLMPGHLLRIKKGKKAREERWYDIRKNITVLKESYSDQVARFRSLFEDCVRLRMRSDVTMATALSGGVDSTAVYSMVHHLMTNGSDNKRVPADWQQAFTQTFPGTHLDEKEWAQKAVSHTGGKTTYLVTDHSNLAQNIVESTQFDDFIYSTPLIALTGAYEGMRKNGVSVSLDGHGVDEMLFGYKNLVHAAHQFHCWHASREEAIQIADVLVGLLPEEQREQKRLIYIADIDNALKRRNSIVGAVGRIVKKLRPLPAPLSPDDLLESRSPSPYDFSSLNELNQPVAIDFFNQTLPSLLRNYDKASMRHSIEIRMPFMDYRLVEMSFSLPVSAKLGGGYTKRILRDAMKGVMPEANRVRTYKVGLQAPIGRWLSTHLKELVTDTIHSSAFAQNTYFDGRKIAKSFMSNKDENNAVNTIMWRHLCAHWIQ